jgi:hypothetical protein
MGVLVSVYPCVCLYICEPPLSGSSQSFLCLNASLQIEKIAWTNPYNAAFPLFFAACRCLWADKIE